MKKNLMIVMLVCLIFAGGFRSRYSAIWKNVSGGISYPNGNVNASGSYKIGDSVLAADSLNASATWDPVSIADGDADANDVTVTGAALGDFCLVSFSADVGDLILDAQVTAENTVTCVLANNTGGAVDLASGTVYVRVIGK